MREFYTRFYAKVESSRAHAEFCERAFGRDLCQHGFAGMSQLDALIHGVGLGPGQTALDLGCGNGMIAEYISDCTGAAVTGLDYIPGAIAAARRRTAAKSGRLSFVEGDINALDLPAAAYDAIIAIDTIYFSEDYTVTVGRLRQALRLGGRMAFLYSHGREPWIPVEAFPAETLAPDKTPLAVALQANGLAFEARDFTAEDYRSAGERQAILAELRPRFEAEDFAFVYDNRMGEARGIRQAIEEGLHRRYLYLCSL